MASFPSSSTYPGSTTYPDVPPALATLAAHSTLTTVANLGALDAAAPDLWLRTEAITGLGDGATVPNWPDSSRSGLDASQATAANQPTYKVGVTPTGKAVVRFAGSHFLASSATPGASSQTIIAVARLASLGSIRTLRGTTNAGGLQFRYEASGQLGAVKEDVVNVAGGTGVSSTTLFEVVAFRFDASQGPTWTFYRNGIVDATGTNTGVLPFASTTTQVGRNGSSGAEYLNGDVAVLASWSRALTDAEMGAVSSELVTRYVTPSTAAVAVLTASSSLTAAGAVTTTTQAGAAALTASSSLTAAATVVPGTAVVMTASSSLTAAATVVHTYPGAVALAASSSLTADATVFWEPWGLTGKQLWLRAKDLPVGAATAWPDKSGTNVAITGTGGAGQDGVTPSGGRALVPTGSTFPSYGAPSWGMPKASSGEFWIVVESYQDPNGAWTFGTSGTGNRFTAGRGDNVWDDTGTSTQNVFSLHGATTINTWRVYRVVVSGGTWTAYLDNTQSYRGTGVTRAWASAPKALASFNGAVAEILVFSRTLSTTEATTVYRYLNAQHGLSVPAAITLTADAPLAASSRLTVSAFIGATTISAGAALVASSSLTATVAPIRLGEAALVASSELKAAAQATLLQASAALTAASVLQATPVPPAQWDATITLFAASALFVDADNAVSAVAALVASSSLDVDGTAFTPFHEPKDPRTGRPQYRLIVAHRDGERLAELTNATVSAIESGVGVGSSFNFEAPTTDPEMAYAKVAGRQAQVWRGTSLEFRGPIVTVDDSAENGVTSVKCRDPFWYLESGRRVIGAIPKRDLLINGSFQSGDELPWQGGFAPDSIPAAQPIRDVIDVDFFGTQMKALQISGVDKVVTVTKELKTAAVFVPNSAAYLPGGESTVKAVAALMPKTGSLTVDVKGYTADDRINGDYGDGMELSLARARAAAATIRAVRPNAKTNATGYGYYYQVPGGLDANRRVVVSWSGVQTAAGHRQYEVQKVTVRQPVDKKAPLPLTFVGWTKITKWLGASKDGWGVYIQVAKAVSSRTAPDRTPSGAVIDTGPNEDDSATYRDTLTWNPNTQQFDGTPDRSPSGAQLKTGTAASYDDGTTWSSSLQVFTGTPDKSPDGGKRTSLLSDGSAIYDDGIRWDSNRHAFLNANGTPYYPAPNPAVKLIDSAHADIDVKTPRNRWLRMEATVELPADGINYEVQVRFYPPAGTALWTRGGLYPGDQLGYFDVDQALIIKALVEHAQDPKMGKGDLGIGTRCQPTGIVRTREYPYDQRMPIDQAINEIATLFRGPEVGMEVTATTQTVVTYHPQQGKRTGEVLIHGGNVVAFEAPLDNREAASSIIMQADGSGADREEGYASDVRALDGLMLERVVSTEGDTPVTELEEAARKTLRQLKNPQPAVWVTIDPDRTGEVVEALGQGDIVRAVIPDADIDGSYRYTKRRLHPGTDVLELMLTPEED